MTTVDQMLAEGLAHHRGGRVPEARSLYARVLDLEPSQPDALALFGTIELQAGRATAALSLLSRALALQPDRRDALIGRARALQQMGEPAAAIGQLKRGLALRGSDAGLLFELGQWLFASDPLAALRTFSHALQLQPDAVGPLCGIGAALDRLGRAEDAARTLRMAGAFAPQHPPAWLMAGLIARSNGRLGDALRDLARALALVPNSIEALDALVWCRQLAGDVRGTVRAARAAHQLVPDRVDLHASYILSLLPVAAASTAEILAQCRAWDARFARSLSGALPPPGNDPDPDRRLRVGYIAAQGFRMHTTASVLWPLIEGHDSRQVEVFCYSDVAPNNEDWVTQRLQSLAFGWCRAGGLSDAELAQQIRSDRIDVLVDMYGYPPGSRLLSLARRPAPVQVNGLPMGSFGLDAVAWAITDDQLTPAGSEEWFHERLLRVPLAYCYRPLVPAPEAKWDPAASRGIVFSSLNQPGKISEAALAAWARILLRLPDARLVLKGMGFIDAAVRAAFLRRARSVGMPEERLELRPWSSSTAEHLATYDEIDIALDPFPYCGVTTTCEALSIGVPVVTLAGDRVIGRYGATFLSAIGLGHLVADSVERYVDIASTLASDRRVLAELRVSLRRDFAASAICDGAAYARSLEAAYRVMWRDWCSRR
ncbi:MAG: tetratricopeptide repeat protein [Proteobacteria bacterium]|nr:tetratricopeptide repeat protein [Pseudomonadota bacterium]